MTNTNIYISQFLLLAAAHFLALISPGPDFAVIISQSIRHGRKTGMSTALGIGCGISVHVLYTLLGIGLLIKTHLGVMTAAKFIGAAYLIYLGILLLCSRPSATPLQESTPQLIDTPSPGQAFRRGFFTNATNPKATLFFLAIFTTIVAADTPLLIQALYGLWMCVITTLWFVFVAVMLSKPVVRRQFARLGHWFERLMGGVLLLFALRLLRDELI